MKYNLKSISMALAAMFGMTLASCQNEDAQLNIDNAEGQKEYITVEAILDDDTRATLTQNQDVLKLAWAVDDKIEVVNASTGKHLGTLSVSEVIANNSKRCKFSGSIDFVSEETTLNLFYLSGKTMGLEGKTPTDLSVSFAEQNGTANSFNDFNIMIGKKENYVSGQGGQIDGVKFERHFAYGYFILKCDNEYLDVTDVPITISANTGTLHNVAALKFKEAEYKETEGDIKVTKTVAGSGEYANAFFVNFFPTSAVNLKFSCDVNGNHFEGTKGSELLVNTFYSNNGAPIVVEMTNTTPTYTITYKCGFDYAPKGETNVEISTLGEVKASTYNELDLTVPVVNDFKGWKEQKADGALDENLISAGDILTFEEGQTTKILVAQWETEELTVIYTDGVENEVVFEDDIHPGLSTGKNNMPAFQGSTDREGYKFEGWKPTINPDVELRDFDNGVLKYIATWSEITNKVGFNYEDGNGNVTEDTSEVTITDPSVKKQVKDGPEKSGYKFLYWKDKDSDKTYNPETEVTFTKDSGVITLVPVWEKLPNTVSTSGYGHGTIEM